MKSEEMTAGKANRYRFRRRSRQCPTGSWCACQHTSFGYQYGDAFKQTLLRAKSIDIQGTSAMFLKTKVFPELGIADALAGKLSGAGTAEVASGGLEMVVLPVSKIVRFRSVDFVGTIPADLQLVQVFAAAIVKGAKNPEASKRLIDFLALEKATPRLRNGG